MRTKEAASANVVVVGAGVSGLTCAIDLARQGLRVTILESASFSGGKASVVSLPRAPTSPIDVGPTVLTMVWVFEELFADAGRDFRHEVPLDRAQILARHWWPDGPRLDLCATREESAENVRAAFGPRSATEFLAFCEDGRRLFELSERPFLRSQRPSFHSIAREFGLKGLTAFARLDAYRSMWSSLEQRFSDPRLRQLFGRYATYCGSSPFEAPGTLNLIFHIEQAQGVYRVRGGMRNLVVGLEALARSLGVEILHERRVDRLVLTGEGQSQRATGVITRDGELFPASGGVVFNGDVSALGELLPPGPRAQQAAKETPRHDRSFSAVTWATVVPRSSAPLVQHNVFFSSDYRREFEQLLGSRRSYLRSCVPDEPTVYVCAQDRGDGDGGEQESALERLFILVNAPATGDSEHWWTEAERKRCTTAMLRVLEKTAGMTGWAEPRELDDPNTTAMSTPVDFHRRFPKTGGALYGPRSTSLLSALGRQEAASKTVSGLYFASGSVHPGAGVPMAALSGRLAASRLVEDLGSIARSHRVAISGITSTD